MNLHGKILILSILSIIGCKKQKIMNIEKTLKTVEYVDIERFMGDWYVIANIPTFIEKNACNAIESYKLNARGEIQTTFSFYQDSPNGKRKEYNPKGYIYNTETNAEWRMQFIWPFKMPFLIIDLDTNYSYTVIGVPSHKYVWIMSRKPSLGSKTYNMIIDKLKDVGYDVKQIKKVTQEW
jgi:apolipoprotein D and lipocalin family protein